MAGRFRKRHVEAPDGTRWVVERHWLARRPRYIGYRFGAKRRAQEWEPPLPGGAGELPTIRRERPAGLPGPKVYGDNRDVANEERARKRRRRGGGGVWIDWWPWNWGGSSSGGRSGGFSWGGRSGGGGPSSGGGSRGSSGGGRRAGVSRGGGKRGGGDGGGGNVLAWILIAIVVIVAAVVIVFVVIPALLFIAGYLLFWVLVAGWIVYNAVTGRPWIVKATRDGYEEPDYAYRIKGWRNCQVLIDDIADDLRRGEPPTPSEVAVEVELIED